MILETDKSVPKNSTDLAVINATVDAADENDEEQKPLLGKRANRGYNPKYDSNSNQFICGEGAVKV